jgi:hypothetical protein
MRKLTRPLGKGEVVSSILTGSTRKNPSRALPYSQLRLARMLVVQLGLTPTAKKTTPGHCG